VEASVVARLLGVRLLTLDATIAVVPAELTAATSRPSAPENRALRPRSGARGYRLSDAVDNLEAGAKVLAEVHRNGSPRRPPSAPRRTGELRQAPL
jgi:hypothetical protein